MEFKRGNSVSSVNVINIFIASVRIIGLGVNNEHMIGEKFLIIFIRHFLGVPTKLVAVSLGITFKTGFVKRVARRVEVAEKVVERFDRFYRVNAIRNAVSAGSFDRNGIIRALYFCRNRIFLLGI